MCDISIIFLSFANRLRKRARHKQAKSNNLQNLPTRISSRSISMVKEIILSTRAPESRDNVGACERNEFIREYYLFFCFIEIRAMSICQMNPSRVFVFYASYILIYTCLLIYILIVYMFKYFLRSMTHKIL